MEYKYGADTDTLLITLSDETPDFGEQEGNIINHYNKDGKPVEIEILNASETSKKISEAIGQSSSE
jgi:uncharacterized protein YuzE